MDATPIKLTFPADIYFNSVVHWAASATGPWLAGNDYDAGIVIWEAASGRWLQRLMGHKAFYGDGATDGVTALTFSPNTDLLASGGADGTVRLWDPATGAEVRRFDVSAGSITDLAFSADGRYLAASTSAGVVRVYGLPSP